MLQKRFSKLLPRRLQILRVFVLAISLLLLVPLLYYLIRGLLVVKRIDCYLTNQPCPQLITEKLSRYKGTNILWLNTTQVQNLLNQISSIKKVTIKISHFGLATFILEADLPPIYSTVYLISNLPVLTMDDTSATESTSWRSPTEEIADFGQSLTGQNFEIWSHGLITPTSSSKTNVSYFTTDKPQPESVKSIYQLSKIADRYLDNYEIYVWNQIAFLRQTGQPDIIVSIPFDYEPVNEAIRSYSRLVSLKKNAKVVDLRFKNPTIR